MACLACFDGERTELDLRESLVRITGDLDVGDLVRDLVDATIRTGTFCAYQPDPRVPIEWEL